MNSFFQKISGFRERVRYGNFVANIPLVLSFLAFLRLYTEAGSGIFLPVFLALSATGASFFFTADLKRLLTPRALPGFLAALLIVFNGVLPFLHGQLPFPGVLRHLCENAGCSQQTASILSSMFHGLLSLPFLIWFITVSYEKIRGWMQDTEKDSVSAAVITGTKKFTVPVYAFITSAVVIGICSKSSPLYPFNDYCDANCFFTVGKSMLYGLMPYRDLLEQKGPLLYILHALAALISFRSFLGVYFLEVIAAAFFLYFAARTLNLFNGKSNICRLPVIALLTYSSLAFREGDSAEELCLPFLAYALYIGFKAIRLGQLPSAAESFLLGLTAACVLWMKYTMLGFYPGWFLAFSVLAWQKKQFIPLVKTAAAILAGILLLTAPVILYIAANSALGDMWNVYFYSNIFVYPKSMNIPVWNGLLASGPQTFLACHAAAFAAVLLTMPMLQNRKKPYEILLFLSVFAGLYLTVFAGGVIHYYYPLIFSVFIPPGLAALERMIPLPRWWFLIKFRTPAVFTALLLLCAGCAFFISPNTYLLKYSKEEIPQIKFAGIINRYPDATLLNYGCLDTGVYTAAGIVPNCKAFNALNSPLPEQQRLQDEVVRNGAVDFIVTARKYEFENYTCIAEEKFFNYYFPLEFYLYKKNERNPQ